MPTSWAEVGARLAWILGGEPGGAAAADEWTRQAIEAVYGTTVYELPASARSVALQKLIGTLYALEDVGSDGMLPLQADVRARVALVFARYWDGHVLDGPPWRLSPNETDRPVLESLSSDFDETEEP